MWQLQSDKDGKRTYRNTATNSECIQTKCYTDRDGNGWWQFYDLKTLPFTRRFASDKISALFAYGITPQDADLFFAKHKITLRSKDDGEKYERAFNELLEFESKFKMATDPIKKLSSLVCVYYTIDEEPIDSFTDAFQTYKLSLLESDPLMHSFFLSELNTLIDRLANSSN